MKNLMARFANDESGATAIEYGLIAGLIVVAIVTLLSNIGTDLSNVFTKIDGALT
ncbi:MAG: Flp family type IVb pilin [Rhodobacteraceae bacterium]|nr:Flp family type IVb pilin [Paracoccaceae bacterium]